MATERGLTRPSFRVEYGGQRELETTLTARLLRKCTGSYSRPSYYIGQKFRLSAHSRTRGLELKLRSLPKLLLVISLTGLSRLACLRVLKESTRNCQLFASVSRTAYSEINQYRSVRGRAEYSVRRYPGQLPAQNSDIRQGTPISVVPVNFLQTLCPSTAHARSYNNLARF